VSFAFKSFSGAQGGAPRAAQIKLQKFRPLNALIPRRSGSDGRSQGGVVKCMLHAYSISATGFVGISAGISDSQ